MPKVTHVAEYRFYDLKREEAEVIDRLLTLCLLEHGKQFRRDYDSVFKPVADTANWEPLIPEDTDKPSASQKSYARTLFKDLKSEATRCTNEDLVGKAQVLMSEVQALMTSPEATKRTASSCIDAMMAAISDLRFERTGIVHAPG